MFAQSELKAASEIRHFTSRIEHITLRYNDTPSTLERLQTNNQPIRRMRRGFEVWGCGTGGLGLGAGRARALRRHGERWGWRAWRAWRAGKPGAGVQGPKWENQRENQGQGQMGQCTRTKTGITNRRTKSQGVVQSPRLENQ